MTTTNALLWRLETLHERLREERETLQLSQSEFAKLIGVSRLTQLNYENARVIPPLAYMKAAAALGLDVAYVLTGRRHQS